MRHSLLHKSGISYISSPKALKYSMAKNRRFLHLSFFTHLVSTQEIESAVESFFCGKERVVESRAIFFQSFPYGIDVIRGRYKSFDEFAKQFNITVKKTKKAKYTKQEVDSIISSYIKSGKDIPHHHDLTKEGLPAASVIMRYYDHWREPFEIYQTLYQKMGS